MNKKLFGHRLLTVITLILCLGAAVLFWLFVKYCDANDVESISALAAMLQGSK